MRARFFRGQDWDTGRYERELAAYNARHGIVEERRKKRYGEKALKKIRGLAEADGL